MGYINLPLSSSNKENQTKFIIVVIYISHFKKVLIFSTVALGNIVKNFNISAGTQTRLDPLLFSAGTGFFSRKISAATVLSAATVNFFVSRTQPLRNLNI